MVGFLNKTRRKNRMKSDYITVYGIWTAFALFLAFCIPRVEIVRGVISFILVYGVVMISGYFVNRNK